MKIAVIAPLNHPISIPFKGGLENHTWWLVKKLQERGHDVTLFASADSDSSLPLFPISDKNFSSSDKLRKADSKGLMGRFYRALRSRASDAAYQKAADYISRQSFDIVHNNALAAKPLENAGKYNAPIVTVLHTPIFREILQGVKSAGIQSRYIAVSKSLADHWAQFAQSHVVHNGIDETKWNFSGAADAETAIWFGRIHPSKAPHKAIDTAKRAGYRLNLFGNIDDKAYFKSEIEPRLSGDIIYGGNVDHETLNQKLGKASVMICTPEWDEPFGLTLIEALACGTPVISFDGGAVREILTEDSGVIVAKGDTEALADNLDRAASLSRANCRQRFESEFTIDKMIDRYEEFYAKMRAA